MFCHPCRALLARMLPERSVLQDCETCFTSWLQDRGYAADTQKSPACICYYHNKILGCHIGHCWPCSWLNSSTSTGMMLTAVGLHTSSCYHGPRSAQCWTGQTQR